VLDAAYEKLGKPRPEVRADLDALCGGRRPNAISSSDFVLFCFPAEAERNPRWLGSVMAHEVFHQLQYDLSDTRGDRPGTGPRKLGPAWLVEGSAEVMEILFLQGFLPEDGTGFFDVQSPARRSRLGLSDLVAHGSVQGAQGYGPARFAALLLARASGVDSLVEYFRFLGRGMEWDAAFEKAFGMERAVFEAEFETLRRDFGAARDWGKSQ
jgi:hypothetical protein